ncbi:MAG: hypothetical protein ACE5FL_03765 [Myxococcota bacterium]
MRNKRDADAGARLEAPGAGVRRRIGSDLERMGVARQLSAAVARRLESSVAKLSPHEYGAVLGSVAAAYGGRPGADSGICPEDIADVQRLMQGVSEEVQKLDEGLRVLSAYISRLRERGARIDGETVH